MKKIMLVAIFFCAFFLVGNTYVSADAKVDSQYDMEKGGTQMFYETDEDGELITVIVSEDVVSQRLANKSYTVKKSKALRWKISFKVNIKNNKILSTNSSNFETIVGAFSSATCKKDNATRASAKANYTFMGISSNVSVIASISNNKLIIQ